MAEKTSKLKDVNDRLSSFIMIRKELNLKKKEQMGIEFEIGLLRSVEDKLKQERNMLHQMASSNQEYGLSCWQIYGSGMHFTTLF